MIAAAHAPRRRRTRGMPAADQPIAIDTAPTSDPERHRGFLAFGLELLARHQARERSAAAAG